MLGLYLLYLRYQAGGHAGNGHGVQQRQGGSRMLVPLKVTSSDSSTTCCALQLDAGCITQYSNGLMHDCGTLPSTPYTKC